MDAATVRRSILTLGIGTIVVLVVAAACNRIACRVLTCCP